MLRSSGGCRRCRPPAAFPWSLEVLLSRQTFVFAFSLLKTQFAELYSRRNREVFQAWETVVPCVVLVSEVCCLVRRHPVDFLLQLRARGHGREDVTFPRQSSSSDLSSGTTFELGRHFQFLGSLLSWVNNFASCLHFSLLFLS